MFVIVRNLLRRSMLPHATSTSLMAASVYLLHPLQTEAVAYVAGRSDLLSSALAYGSFALYLSSGRGRLAWGRAAAILILLLFACLAKENCVVLPLVFLLTDLYWGEAGTFKSRKIFYSVLASASAILAAFLAYRILPTAQAAGFGLSNLSPAQFFFTECRAFWQYVRLFCFPAGQNADYDFAYSRTVMEHGALAAFFVLAALVALAIACRRGFKLASYGFLLFLLLLAPTSSLIPIADPFVERRMYMPLIGLLLVAIGLTVPALRETKRFHAAVAAGWVLIGLFAVLTWRRSHVWESPLALWTDTVAKSPHKYRPRFQLAYAEYQSGKCAEAASQYSITSSLGSRDSRLLIDWALAEDCAGRPDSAIARLREAAAMDPNPLALTQIGFILARQHKYDEALHVLDQAAAAAPDVETAFVYRALVYINTGELAKAKKDLERALALDPWNPTAAAAYRLVQSRDNAERPPLEPCQRGPCH